MENKIICKCMNVSYAEVDKALRDSKTFSQIEDAFDAVQTITHCSTGCGGCHDEIMDAVSELLHA